MSTKVYLEDIFDGKDISLNITSDMVINELINKGYLDPNLFLTNFFDIRKDLILDSIFDKLAIKNILSKYYHEGYFEMKIEDFLEFHNSPKIKEGELQR